MHEDFNFMLRTEGIFLNVRRERDDLEFRRIRSSRRMFLGHDL